MFKCTACSFYHRTPLVPIINKNSDILVIFDTPSIHNDWDYGNFFTNLFSKYNLNSFNLAHLSRCFKLDEDKPRPDKYSNKETKNCYQHLLNYLHEVPHVKYVLLLGMRAGNQFMKPDVAGEVVGKYVEKDGKFFYCTYNPADVNFRKWLQSKVKSHFNRFFNHFYKNKGLIKPEIPVYTITDAKELPKLYKRFEKLEKSNWPFFTFDIETKGLDVFKKTFKLLTLSFSFNDKAAYVIPFFHKQNQYPILNQMDEVKEFLNKVFGNTKILGVAHNSKFDMKGLLKGIGVQVKNLGFDTQAAWHVLYNDEKKGLKDVVFKLTDYGGYEQEIDKKNIVDFEQIPLDKLIVYNGYDTALTYKIFKTIQPIIKKRGAEILCYEIYPEAIMAFMEMEMTGFRLDKTNLNKYKLEYLNKIEYLKLKVNSYPEAKQACKLLGLRELNLDSTKHLQMLLFGILKLKKREDSAGGTDKDSLELYSRVCDHQVLKDLLEYSPIEKMYSTYLKSLDTTWLSEDGLIHGNFNITGTENGRPSSKAPNLLNLPRAKWYKSLFLPFNKDYVFIHIDYSQMEIRILANYSMDEVMVHILENKLDPHIITATSMFECSEEEVDKERRQSAKPVNFGIAYGSGPAALARNLTLDLGKDVSTQTAAQYIQAYRNKYKGNAAFIDYIQDLVGKQGYVQNIFGRRRNLAKGKYGDNSAKREGINAMIQGTANELMFYALGKQYKWLRENNIDAKMCLSVYDSTLIAVRNIPELIRKVSRKAQEIMVHAPYNSMRVPIEADAEIGKNYGYLYAHDFDNDVITLKEADKKNNIAAETTNLKNFLTK